MKFKAHLAKLLTFSAMLFALLSLSAFADSVTQQKLVFTYNEYDRTVDAELYISKGTAIVGYCSFDYDSEVLTLIDIYGDAVPSDVPLYGEDGKTAFIKQVVSGENGVEITDVGKGSDKLIETKRGHVFFAWYLPSSIPFIDATEEPVLIATFKFELSEDARPNDIYADTLKVAGEKLTEKVPGWFSGLVVLDKDQKKFTYDGKGSNTALFYSQTYVYDELIEEKSGKIEEDSIEEPDENDNDIPGGIIDGNDEIPDDGDENKDDENNEDPDVTDTDDTNVDTPTPPKVDEGENGIDITGNAQVATSLDFGIVVSSDACSIKVKWQKPAELTEVDGYTVFLTDGDYNSAKTVSGVSSLSTSYTISNVASGRDYVVYIIAKADGKYYSSKAIRTSTIGEGTRPTVITSTAYYDGTEGYLYGINAEECVFGESPTKVPEVYAPNGKYFIGWSRDQKTVVDITSEKIYSDTTFYAMFSDTEPKEKQGYITGYDDGTFKPEGNITRAEAAVIISRIVPDYDNDKTYTHSFSDVKAGYWYENPIAFCLEKGYIMGYEDGTFNPQGNITRAEIATILVRVFGFDGTLGINVFSDLDRHWGKDNISILYGAGIVCPDKDGNFRPDEKLTRVEAVKILSGCLGIIPDREKIISSVKENGYSFSDVPQYSDYFFDVYAALMTK